MNKVYAIVYGFYSSLENGEYDTFWSTRELAEKYLQEQVKSKNLIPQRNKQTGELNGAYTDGDYYVYILEIDLDVEVL